jgi:hypothetical protein
MVLVVNMTPVMLTDSTGYWFGFDDVFTGPVDEIIVLGLLALAVYIGIPGAAEILDSTVTIIDDILGPVNDAYNDLACKVKEYRNSIGMILSTLVVTNLSKLNHYDNHHIVAQNDPRAGMSRMVLSMSDIDINDSRNLVGVRKPIHWVLHTNEYHAAVTVTLWGAYAVGGKTGVESELATIKFLIEGANGKIG